MGTQPPSQKGGGARGRNPPPNFRPMYIVAKRLDGSRWHLAWRWASVQATCDRYRPSCRPQKGSVAPSPILGPFLLLPNGWMHQDVTWLGLGLGLGGRPQSWGLFVRLRPSPLLKRGRNSPNFRPMLWPNVWMDQDGTGHGDRPHPRGLCVRIRSRPRN